MTTTTLDNQVKERLIRRRQIQKQIDKLEFKVNNFQAQKLVSKKPEITAYCDRQIKAYKELIAKMEKALRTA